MSDFLSVSQWAKLQGKDPSYVRKLLIQGRIPGQKIGAQWVIPVGTQLPPDGRVKTGNYKNWRKPKSTDGN